MRLFSFLFAATLTALSSSVGAACDTADGCAQTPATASGPTPAMQVAQLPGQVVPATLSDGRPTGALVMRPEPVRAPARSEQVRAEQAPSTGSEPSSVWLMLFAGFAFAGFVVAKRSRG